VPRLNNSRRKYKTQDSRIKKMHFELSWVLYFLLELFSLGTKLSVGQCLESGFKSVDSHNKRLEFLRAFGVGTIEKLG
jgi:hypothetical protein